MVSRLLQSRVPLVHHEVNHLATTNQLRLNVAVCGASGAIGQPLSLLLKHSILIKELNLHDIVDTFGVATDLSHIPTVPKVKSYFGTQQLKDALTGAQIVVITAGMPRKPGMSREDLFDTNAYVIKDITEAIADAAPKAIIGVITNPINSLIPIAAEVMKKAGVFDPKKLMGITTLDVIRARTFIGRAKCVDPMLINVPVVGGHTGTTIVPLVSRTTPPISFAEEELEAIVSKIQGAGTEIVNAKGSSSTLAMAYAAALFVDDLCRAITGEPNIVHCAYVTSEVEEVKYLASPVLLGPDGAQQNLGVGKTSEFESTLLREAIPIIRQSIEKGENFVHKS